jgi:hypothetical protein
LKQAGQQPNALNVDRRLSQEAAFSISLTNDDGRPEFHPFSAPEDQDVLRVTTLVSLNECRSEYH